MRLLPELEQSHQDVMSKQFILTPMGLQPVDSAYDNTHVAKSHAVSAGVHVPPASRAENTDDTSFLNLKEIAKEVFDLGARHLDSRHDAASFESSRLMKIGIKLPKRQRIGTTVTEANLSVYVWRCSSSFGLIASGASFAGAKHGIPSISKTKKREKQKEQDLIDSGMLAIRARTNLKAKKSKEGKNKKYRGLHDATGVRAGLLKVDSAALKSKNKVKEKNGSRRRR